jgi:hypothetical protein
VPSDHRVEGDLYDLLSCVDSNRVIVAQCGFEWIATCGARPICHDELDGGAKCYPTGARFCDTPGETECSEDLSYAYRCTAGGYLSPEWCAGEENVCSRATGQCYADDLRCLEALAKPAICLTSDVLETCLPPSPDVTREYCPRGCTETADAAACNP